MTPVWYQVRDLQAGRAFYTGKLGFDETYVDSDGSWVKLERNGMEIGLAEGEPQEDGGVAHVDVEDVKAVAEDLRNGGVEVGSAGGLYESVNLLRQPSLRGDDEVQAPEAHKHARDRVSSVASHPQPTEFDETHKTPHLAC